MYGHNNRSISKPRGMTDRKIIEGSEIPDYCVIISLSISIQLQEVRSSFCDTNSHFMAAKENQPPFYDCKEMEMYRTNIQKSTKLVVLKIHKSDAMGVHKLFNRLKTH
jgi:hypothetical protein